MKETSHNGLFWRIGSLVYRYRWVVIWSWVVMLLFFGLLAQKVPGMLKDNGFTPKGSDSDWGLIQLQRELELPATILNLVYTGQGMDLTQENQKQIILESLHVLKKSLLCETSFLLIYSSY